MALIRIIAIFFVASLAAGQEIDSASSSGTREPKLPVIDYGACPGKSEPIPDVKLVQDDLIYSLPGAGKVVAKLSAGDKVTVLAGANVIRQPDRAVVRYFPTGDKGVWPPVKVGETVLGYGWRVDGNMAFWAKGAWFEEDIESVAEGGMCGFKFFGPGGCSIEIVKGGVIEWWVQIKTFNGAGGWVRAVTYTDDNRWYRWYGNFYDVLQGHCNLD
jgi:hypothetical protein